MRTIYRVISKKWYKQYHEVNGMRVDEDIVQQEYKPDIYFDTKEKALSGCKEILDTFLNSLDARYIPEKDIPEIKVYFMEALKNGDGWCTTTCGVINDLLIEISEDVLDIKIWVDDIRPAPKGYIWCQSTNEALVTIFNNIEQIDIIDLDHDMGYTFGGDAIKILEELERKSYHSEKIKRIAGNIEFRLHSMNPVGVENMRRIIQKNGWKEIR